MTGSPRRTCDRLHWYASNSLSPAFWAVCLYRLAHALYRHGVPLVPAVIDCISRVLTGVDIHHRADIGAGLVVIHGAGLVVGSGVRIGGNCVLMHNVTLGVRRPRYDDGRDPAKYPTIGNDVHIYVGAVVVGPITVGDRVTIAANAVVLEDVPSGATVVGPPSRIVPPRGVTGQQAVS